MIALWKLNINDRILFCERYLMCKKPLLIGFYLLSFNKQIGVWRIYLTSIFLLDNFFAIKSDTFFEW